MDMQHTAIPCARIYPIEIQSERRRMRLLQGTPDFHPQPVQFAGKKYDGSLEDASHRCTTHTCNRQCLQKDPKAMPQVRGLVGSVPFELLMSRVSNLGAA
eukprot:1435403-Amphidinium_carterae.1